MTFVVEDDMVETVVLLRTSSENSEKDRSGS